MCNSKVSVGWKYVPAYSDMVLTMPCGSKGGKGSKGMGPKVGKGQPVMPSPKGSKGKGKGK